MRAIFQKLLPILIVTICGIAVGYGAFTFQNLRVQNSSMSPESTPSSQNKSETKTEAAIANKDYTDPETSVSFTPPTETILLQDSLEGFPVEISTASFDLLTKNSAGSYQKSGVKLSILNFDDSTLSKDTYKRKLKNLVTAGFWLDRNQLETSISSNVLLSSYTTDKDSLKLYEISQSELYALISVNGSATLTDTQLKDFALSFKVNPISPTNTPSTNSDSSSPASTLLKQSL